MSANSSTFQAPIAGQSLTKPFGSMPHQKPPQFVEPNDALEYMWKELQKPTILQNVWHLAEKGMPTNMIGIMIVYKAAMMSIINIDLAVIILKQVINMIEVLCTIKGIKFNKKPEIDSSAMKMYTNEGFQKMMLDKFNTPEAQPQEAQAQPPAAEQPQQSNTGMQQPPQQQGLMNNMMASQAGA